MNVIFGVIKYLALVAVVGTIFYARGLYLELKATKAKLTKAEEANQELKKELQEAYYQIEIYNSAEHTKGE